MTIYRFLARVRGTTSNGERIVSVWDSAIITIALLHRGGVRDSLESCCRILHCASFLPCNGIYTFLTFCLCFCLCFCPFLCPFLSFLFQDYSCRYYWTTCLFSPFVYSRYCCNHKGRRRFRRRNGSCCRRHRYHRQDNVHWVDASNRHRHHVDQSDHPLARASMECGSASACLLEDRVVTLADRCR
jgi:hypothetical protein